MSPKKRSSNKDDGARMNVSGKLKAVHPGSILKEELEERDVTQTRVARDLNVSYLTVNEICNEKRSITTDMAVRLEKYIGVSAEFWINVQRKYDLEISMEKMKEEIKGIPQLEVA